MITNKKFFFFGGIVCLQIVLLIYCNFFHVQDVVDNDFAKLARHAMEMWNNKTLFIPDWDYLTTGEMDCAALLAIPLYGITGNIWLSFGLSNIMNIFICCLVVMSLLRSLCVKREHILLALAVLLVPYDWGQLEYTNMLFFGGGQYIYKMLLPIMLLALLAVKEEHRKKKSYLLLVVCYLVLLLISAISSGIYVFICGIFPIVVCKVIYQLCKENPKEADWYEVFLLVSSVIVAGMGILLAKVLEVSSLGSSFLLITAGELWGAVQDNIKAFFLLFGAFPQNQYTLLSVSGISHLCKLVIVVGILFWGLKNINRCFHLKEAFGQEYVMQDKPQKIKCYLISIFVWNTIVVGLTTQYSRYHLIGAIPLMLLAVICLGETLEKVRSVLFAKVFSYAVGCLLMLISLCSVAFAKETYFPNGDYAEEAKEIIAYLADKNVETVVFLNDSGMAEEIRAYDMSKNYVTYHADEQRIYDKDYYLKTRERAYHDDKTLLFKETKGGWEMVPSYVLYNYKEVGTVGRYTVYYSEENYMDGLSGFPLEGYSIDYCYSPGYVYDGTVTDKGVLLTTGEVEEVLISPAMENERGSCTITLNLFTGPYEGKIGTFELWDENGPVTYENINGLDYAVELQVPKKGTYRIKVRMDKGKLIGISNITYRFH